MKNSSALFLQVALVLLGLVVGFLMLWEPHLEGRNAHATTFEIYFKDPFLAYVYVGSTPFFVALYRAFGLFAQFRKDGAFSPATVDALRAIKQCALILIGFIAGGLVIVIMFGDHDDRPAGVFMGLLVTLGACGIATTAALFARSLQNTLARSAGSRG